MSNVDVTIYRVVKKVQPPQIESDILKQFDYYTVNEEHFSEVKDLLDFGRESRYNSQLSSSDTIFIDDELGAYKLAHERNIAEYNKLLQFIDDALHTPILDNSTAKTGETCAKHRLNASEYPWKLVRLNQAGVIKLCKRKPTDIRMYPDSVFISDSEKESLTKVSTYNDLYKSHISFNIDKLAYDSWSDFIDHARTEE